MDAPRRISRYEIKNLIARGGMGEVYLARDPNTDRLVVVKLLAATLESPELRERFEREARALASLNHPNIVHIYDYGDVDDSPFIVIEYVKGETLAEKVKRRTAMALTLKLKLLSELCAGLAHAHAAGIIHRDVKPGNLMVDQEERLKILDFGIARVADSNLTTFGMKASQVMQIGTPGYMSPEQVQGADIDARSDLFAVGAVAYTLLAYREPFAGKDPDEIEKQVMLSRPAPLTSLLPDLDPEVEAIVERALSKSRDKRYPDAKAMREALDRCWQRLAHPAPPLTAAHPSRPRPARQDDSSTDSVPTILIRTTDWLEPADTDKTIMLPPTKKPAAPPASSASPSTVRVPPAPPRPAPAPNPFASSPRSQPAAPLDPAALFGGSSGSRQAPPMPTGDETMLLPRPEKRRDAPAGSRGPGPIKPTTPAIKSAASREKPAAQSWWSRIAALPAELRAKRPPTPSARKPAAPRRAGDSLWQQYGASLAIAAGLMVVIAFGLIFALWLGGWIGGSGYVLTVAKPDGGTITGSGLRCGTRGSDCVVTLEKGAPVELAFEADEGYAFGGYTGDCNIAGRTEMSRARNCGATFERVIVNVNGKKTWTLTIERPTGGTLMSAGIECGTMGTVCSREIPDGAPVEMLARADAKFAHSTFTGDCQPTGIMKMTGPRTCGALFVPVGEGRAAEKTPPPPRGGSGQNTGLSGNSGRGGPPPKSDPPPNTGTTTTASTAQGSASTLAPSGQTTSPDAGTGQKVVTPEKVDPVVSDDDHAWKAEIPELLNKYCPAQMSLDPQRMKEIMPSSNVNELRRQYNQYKSITCEMAPEREKVQLDGTKGTALVKVTIKQTILMKSGGAPQVNETIVDMTLVRPEVRTTWHIAKFAARPKPKP
jgi:serine/threonine protein kinase